MNEPPRIAAHQGGMCEMRQSRRALRSAVDDRFLTQTEAVNKSGSSEEGSFFLLDGR